MAQKLVGVAKDIREIVPTGIGPKSFGTVEKQAPGSQVTIGSEAYRREIAVLLILWPIVLALPSSIAKMRDSLRS